ncbi:MAG: hypothetical protein O6942_07870 [Bacteroidetes bacterium]|nr:hypothetical protein [Bacteroidota bacterium]
MPSKIPFIIPSGVARVLQVVVFILTLGVLAGLFTEEGLTLLLLWSIIIPILPASFLIAPSLWRAVCLLAAAHMLGSGHRTKKAVFTEGLYRAEILGAVDAGLYDRYSGPAIATAVSVDPAGDTGIRVLGLLLVGFWFQFALRYLPRIAGDDQPVPISTMTSK